MTSSVRFKILNDTKEFLNYMGGSIEKAADSLSKLLTPIFNSIGNLFANSEKSKSLNARVEPSELAYHGFIKGVNTALNNPHTSKETLRGLLEQAKALKGAVKNNPVVSKKYDDAIKNLKDKLAN